MPYVVTSECILCGACSSGCQSNAITEGDTQAHIDVSICIECGTCEQNCPSAAILFIQETETKEAAPGETVPAAATQAQVEKSSA